MSMARHSPNHSARTHRVEALCVHWTGGTYASAVDWVCRADSQVSYHAIVDANGLFEVLVPWDRAAWAVGRSHQPAGVRFTFGLAGNSATENIAIAGAPPVKPSAAAVASLVALIASRFQARAWSVDEMWRIVGHADLAMPRGRKTDPEGNGWLPLTPVRDAVRTVLQAMAR